MKLKKLALALLLALCVGLGTRPAAFADGTGSPHDDHHRVSNYPTPNPSPHGGTEWG